MSNAIRRTSRFDEECPERDWHINNSCNEWGRFSHLTVKITSGNIFVEEWKEVRKFKVFNALSLHIQDHGWLNIFVREPLLQPYGLVGRSLELNQTWYN